MKRSLRPKKVFVEIVQLTILVIPLSHFYLAMLRSISEIELQFFFVAVYALSPTNLCRS